MRESLYIIKNYLPVVLKKLPYASILCADQHGVRIADGLGQSWARLGLGVAKKDGGPRKTRSEDPAGVGVAGCGRRSSAPDGGCSTAKVPDARTDMYAIERSGAWGGGRRSDDVLAEMMRRQAKNIGKTMFRNVLGVTSNFGSLWRMSRFPRAPPNHLRVPQPRTPCPPRAP